MPSLVDTIEIVHRCEAQEFWSFIGGFAAVGVLCCAAIVMLPRIWAVVAGVLDHLNKQQAQRFMLLGAILLAGYAGTKGFVGGRVSYPFTDPETRYLVDRGSFVTNDWVHVDFTRFLVPDSAMLYVDACPISSTNVNADAFNVWEGTMGAFNAPRDIPYAAATNFNWYVYTDWTPGPAVHTNGVLQMLWRKWQEESEKNRGFFVPSRTGIYDNGRRLTPPSVPDIHIEADLSKGPSDDGEKGKEVEE